MLKRLILLTAILAIGAVLVVRADRPEPVPERTAFTEFPMQLGDWTGSQQAPFSKDILDVLGVDDYMTRAYFKPDRSGVGLYVGYYGSQRQGDTMHSPQNCLPGAGWEPLSSTMLDISVGDGAGATRSIEVNRYLIQKGLDRQLVLYWYQSHGRVVASEYWSKLYLIRDAVRLNRTDGALVRVIAPILGPAGVGENPQEEARAEQLATSFVQTLFPALRGYLPQ